MAILVLLVPGSPFGVDRSPHFWIAYENLSKDALETAPEWLSGYFEPFYDSVTVTVMVEALPFWDILSESSETVTVT